MAQARRQELPDNTITVKDGKVQKLEIWTLWNGQPWSTIFVERFDAGGFQSKIGDPEHGSAHRAGADLEMVVGRMHEKSRKQYVQLFSLENPSDDDIRALGFQERYVIRRT